MFQQIKKQPDSQRQMPALRKHGVNPDRRCCESIEHADKPPLGDVITDFPPRAPRQPVSGKTPLMQDRAVRALALFEQIAPEVESFVSPYVLGTLSRLDVAPLYAAAGRTDEAIAAAQWGVDDLEYRYGPDDQLTIAARTLLAQLQAARQGS